MPSISGYPYVKAQFDKNGQALSSPALPAGLTDIIVISHGWNNDDKEAQKLYDNFFANFRKQEGDLETQRQIGVIGIFWPSKKFNVELAVDSATAGGAASVSSRAAAKKELTAQLKAMAPLFSTPAQKKALAALKKLLPDIETKATARAQFLKIIRTELVTPKAANKEDSSLAFFKDAPEDIMQRLRITSANLPPTKPIAGGATSLRPGATRAARTDTTSAVGIKSILSGFSAAIGNILNFTTYYEMKTRAGEVGRTGVATLLDSLPAEVKRVHLIGHSFGGRLVTSAAQQSKTKKIATLTLLQAAFSHNGFSASEKGAFRDIVDKQRVNGPILVSHTANDKAVGLAYPIASRLAGDSTLALGDETSKYGGLGRNGVQKMTATERVVGTLLDTGATYAFKRGVFFNLESSKFINGHSAITGPEVTHAVRTAIATAK